MLNALRATTTGIPTGVTNVASFYPTVTTVQTAIAAGYSPTDWANLSASQQAAALANATAGGAPSGGTGTPIISGPGGGGIIQFSGGATIPVGYGSIQVGTGSPTTLTPAQIQAAVNAGLTPTQFEALTPTQQAQMLAAHPSTPAAGTTANAAMPIVLIGIALFLALAASKGR